MSRERALTAIRGDSIIVKGWRETAEMSPFTSSPTRLEEGILVWQKLGLSQTAVGGFTSKKVARMDGGMEGALLSM